MGMPRSIGSIDTPVAPTQASNGSTNPPTGFSTIERFVKEPNRFALYGGLDFYGLDFWSGTTATIGACASACLSQSQSCKAFTYNDHAIAGRANCYLKSETVFADGNVAAVSGMLLRRTDGPRAFPVGVIDPADGMVSGVDLPGNDLSSRPQGANTAQGCRRACVTSSACNAFTYVKRLKQCWLKSQIGSPHPELDAVSGAKKQKVFEADKIISLD